MPVHDDPAIVQAPWGPEVDGRRLLHEAVGFGRALRAAGLHIDLGAAVDYARALPLVDVGEREQVRAAGEAIFVRRRDDRETYDAVFDRWWRAAQPAPGRLPGAAPPAPGEQAMDGEAAGETQPIARRRALRPGRRRARRADADLGRRRQPTTTATSRA